jgi:hypothetical protein
MKKFKKLIPALAMLLVATMLLGSSTYAWFSMNTTVSASEMKIVAKAADPFLQIKSSTDTDWDVATTTLKQLATDKELLLVAPTSITAGTVAWGAAVSTDPDEVQASNNVKAVAAANLADYVLADTLSFRNTSSTAPAEELVVNNVNVTKEGTDKLAPSARVLFVWADGYAMYNADGTLIGGNSKIADLTVKGGAKDSIDVQVYMYFDGTDDAAYTNNAEGLADVSANFVFTIKGDAAHVAPSSATYTFPTLEPAAP